MSSEPKEEGMRIRLLKILRTPIPAIGTAILIVVTVATTVFSIVLIDKDAMKALIQAEATIFGFFGIIIVYVLKALDDNLHRRKEEERELDRTGEGEKIAIPPRTTSSMLIAGIIEDIRQDKRRVLSFATVIGSLLIASMLLTIWSLGAMNIILESNVGFSTVTGRVVITVGGISILLFFLAVYFLLSFFREIAEIT